MLQGADSALYSAKHTGRDRTAVSQPQGRARARVLQ